MIRDVWTRHPQSAAIVLLALSAQLGGCSAVGELVYDTAAQLERQRCDRLESGPERQACQEKVRTASTQAQTARSKP